MSSKKSTTRKLNSQPQQITPKQLQEFEIARIVQLVCVEFDEHSGAIALLTLLFDHLSQFIRDPLPLATIDQIKAQLFRHTGESEYAQEQFQKDAFLNRGNLLRFPSARRAS